MGRNNQNSKFKAWQSPEPTVVEVKVKPVQKVNEPLKVVEPEPPIDPVTENEPEVKPQLKKGKKVEE